ncbi:hypothetical protein MTO96_045275 [Rhipicephalus appendiculatus]
MEEEEESCGLFELTKAFTRAWRLFYYSGYCRGPGTAWSWCWAENSAEDDGVHRERERAVGLRARVHRLPPLRLLHRTVEVHHPLVRRIYLPVNQDSPDYSSAQTRRARHRFPLVKN